MRAKLQILRAIGWKHWDPIGIGALDEMTDWENHPAVDEYNGYLLRVAGMLMSDSTIEMAVEYLEWVEASQMGLRKETNSHQRAETTVKMIKAYVLTLK